MKKHLFPIVYALLLLGFTTYISLNAFASQLVNNSSPSRVNTFFKIAV